MISQVKGDIMPRSSRPNDHSLLSNIFLRSCVFEGVDAFSLKLFLEATANQLWAHEHEEA